MNRWLTFCKIMHDGHGDASKDVQVGLVLLGEQSEHGHSRRTHRGQALQRPARELKNLTCLCIGAREPELKRLLEAQHVHVHM